MGSLPAEMIEWLKYPNETLVAVFGNRPDMRLTLLVFIGHMTVSLLFALLLVRSFGKRLKSSPIGLYSIFFCFNFFVPVLGAIGTVLTLIFFVRFSKHAARHEFFNVPLPPFQVESASMPVGMGEGGAWSRLRETALPRGQRLKALLAVGTSAGSNSNRFLQLASIDSDDEIRLLAINLCGRQEQSIQKTISTALEQLKSTSDSATRRALFRSLVFSYWEMIYNSVSQDNLHDFYLEQALKYTNLAHETGENTPDLAILMIRIHLRKRELHEAERAIQEALALGADQFRIMPYQAEIAFLKRDFTALKRLMGQNQMAKQRPTIGPLAQFWGEYAD